MVYVHILLTRVPRRCFPHKNLLNAQFCLSNRHCRAFATIFHSFMLLLWEKSTSQTATSIWLFAFVVRVVQLHRSVNQEFESLAQQAEENKKKKTHLRLWNEIGLDSEMSSWTRLMNENENDNWKFFLRTETCGCMATKPLATYRQCDNFFSELRVIIPHKFSLSDLFAVNLLSHDLLEL